MQKSQNTVVPGFKALGPSTTLCALNPGSALNPGTFFELHGNCQQTQGGF